jgi:hypothetical protein
MSLETLKATSRIDVKKLKTYLALYEIVHWYLNYAQIDLCGCVASFSCHGVCLSSRSMVPGGVLLMM